MDEKRKRTYQYVLWVLIVLTVGFIWSLSLRGAAVSSEQSNSMALSVLSPAVDNINASQSAGESQPVRNIFLEEMLVLIRKVAHFAEFAWLGFLWSLLGRLRWYPAMWTYGLGVAVIDEWLQHFIPGRAMAVRDVVIDYCGFFCGFALVMAVVRWLERKKSRNPRK